MFACSSIYEMFRIFLMELNFNSIGIDAFQLLCSSFKMGGRMMIHTFGPPSFDCLKSTREVQEKSAPSIVFQASSSYSTSWRWISSQLQTLPINFIHLYERYPILVAIVQHLLQTINKVDQAIKQLNIF